MFTRGYLKSIEYLHLLENLDSFEFVPDYKKFGSSATFLCDLLQYLKNHPKILTYMLFNSELNHKEYLDVLCKTVLSSLYCDCFSNADKEAVVGMLEEIIDIYVNFFDVPTKIHSNQSLFSFLYKYLCNQIPEMKIFYKLCFQDAITEIIAEDSLYLDIDPNRAFMRFTDSERNKNFGSIDSADYKEKLNMYKQWTIKKLKYHVSKLINLIKTNISALPSSFVCIFKRIYSKLVQLFNANQVNVISNDLIFLHLICSAIESPEMFGLTDVHISRIARHNLKQCSLILQKLAFSKHSSHQELWSSFHGDSTLSFIIDHILRAADNAAFAIDSKSLKVNHILMPEFELHNLLQFIQVFLNENNQESTPLEQIFEKIPEKVLNFQLTFKSQKKQPTPKLALLNFPRFESNQFSKSKNELSNEFIESSKWFELLQNLNDFGQVLLMNISCEQRKPIGLMSDEDLKAKLGDQTNNLEHLTNLQKVVDEVFRSELRLSSHVPSFTSNQAMETPESSKLIDLSPVSTDLTEMFFETHVDEEASFASSEENLHSLVNSSLNFEDMNSSLDQPGVDVKFSPRSSPVNKHASVDSGTKNIQTESLEVTKSVFNTDSEPIQFPFDDLHDLLSKSSLDHYQKEFSDAKYSETFTPRNFETSFNKSFFSMSNLKSIKDKMKDKNPFKDLNRNNKKISLQTVSSIDTNLTFENKHITSSAQLSNNAGDIIASEIMNKYRPSVLLNDNNVNIPPETQINSLIDFTNSPEEEELGDSHKISICQEAKLKLRKLMSFINLSVPHQEFRFLNIKDKNHFVLFLKVILVCRT